MNRTHQRHRKLVETFWCRSLSNAISFRNSTRNIETPNILAVIAFVGWKFLRISWNYVECDFFSLRFKNRVYGACLFLHIRLNRRYSVWHCISILMVCCLSHTHTHVCFCLLCDCAVRFHFGNMCVCRGPENDAVFNECVSTEEKMCV